MANFGVSAQNQKGLGGQDSTQLLQRIFTGRVVGSPAFPYGGAKGSVLSATDSTCVVQVVVDSAAPAFIFTCDYEPKPQASNTPKWPPVGTRCMVVWPANGDHTPAVTMFYGWPS